MQRLLKGIHDTRPPGLRTLVTGGARLALLVHGGEAAELCYMRTKDGREVDFALVRDGRLERLVECKVADDHPDPSLIRFATQTGAPSTQVVLRLRHEQQAKGVELRRALDWMQNLA